MKEFVKALINLLKVKSLMTIAVMLVFVVLSLNDKIDPALTASVIAAVITYYFTKENKQVIEVDYNQDLVNDYQNNYIMEEEGIGAEEVGTVYDEQTTFNTDSINELLGEGAEVEDEYTNDETNKRE